MTDDKKRSNQFKRTDKHIVDTLVELLDEIPFEKITINDIVSKAEISKSAFYLHYQDKYDLAKHLRDDVFADYKAFYDMYLSEKYTEGEIHEEGQRRTKKAGKYMAAALKINTNEINIQNDITAYLSSLYRRRFPKASELQTIYYGYVLMLYMQYSSTAEHPEPLHKTLLDMILNMIGVPNREETSKDLLQYMERKRKFT